MAAGRRAAPALPKAFLALALLLTLVPLAAALVTGEAAEKLLHGDAEQLRSLSHSHSSSLSHIRPETHTQSHLQSGPRLPRVSRPKSEADAQATSRVEAGAGLQAETDALAEAQTQDVAATEAGSQAEADAEAEGAAEEEGGNLGAEQVVLTDPEDFPQLWDAPGAPQGRQASSLWRVRAEQAPGRGPGEVGQRAAKARGSTREAEGAMEGGGAREEERGGEGEELEDDDEEEDNFPAAYSKPLVSDDKEKVLPASPEKGLKGPWRRLLEAHPRDTAGQHGRGRGRARQLRSPLVSDYAEDFPIEFQYGAVHEGATQGDNSGRVHSGGGPLRRLLSAASEPGDVQKREKESAHASGVPELTSATSQDFALDAEGDAVPAGDPASTHSMLKLAQAAAKAAGLENEFPLVFDYSSEDVPMREESEAEQAKVHAQVQVEDTTRRTIPGTPQVRPQDIPDAIPGIRLSSARDAIRALRGSARRLLSEKGGRGGLHRTIGKGARFHFPVEDASAGEREVYPIPQATENERAGRAFSARPRVRYSAIQQDVGQGPVQPGDGGSGVALGYAEGSPFPEESSIPRVGPRVIPRALGEEVLAHVVRGVREQAEGSVQRMWRALEPLCGRVIVMLGGTESVAGTETDFETPTLPRYGAGASSRGAGGSGRASQALEGMSLELEIETPLLPRYGPRLPAPKGSLPEGSSDNTGREEDGTEAEEPVGSAEVTMDGAEEEEEGARPNVLPLSLGPDPAVLVELSERVPEESGAGGEAAVSGEPRMAENEEDDYTAMVPPRHATLVQEGLESPLADREQVGEGRGGSSTGTPGAPGGTGGLSGGRGGRSGGGRWDNTGDGFPEEDETGPQEDAGALNQGKGVASTGTSGAYGFLEEAAEVEVDVEEASRGYMDTTMEQGRLSLLVLEDVESFPEAGDQAGSDASAEGLGSVEGPQLALGSPRVRRTLSSSEPLTSAQGDPIPPAEPHPRLSTMAAQGIPVDLLPNMATAGTAQGRSYRPPLAFDSSEDFPVADGDASGGTQPRKPRAAEGGTAVHQSQAVLDSSEDFPVSDGEPVGGHGEGLGAVRQGGVHHQALPFDSSEDFPGDISDARGIPEAWRLQAGGGESAFPKEGWHVQANGMLVQRKTVAQHMWGLLRALWGPRRPRRHMEA